MTDVVNPAYKKHYCVPTNADRTDTPFALYYKEMNRPAVVEEYFNGANAIVVHNHLQQGGLKLKQHNIR